LYEVLAEADQQAERTPPGLRLGELVGSWVQSNDAGSFFLAVHSPLLWRLGVREVSCHPALAPRWDSEPVVCLLLRGRE
jgi:hypothetical protein